jgi:hypothetical protein
MTMTNVLFQNNKGPEGGAVLSHVTSNADAVTVTVTGSLFQGNQATYNGENGGGISVNHNTSSTGSASFTISNSTFYQNSANEGSGGGIAISTSQAGSGSNTVALTSLTITQNQAVNQGGGLWVNASTAPVVDNSIIAGNVINNPAADGPDVFGTLNFNRSNYNLIGVGDPNGKQWNATNIVGTADNPKNPGLDPAGTTDNGGPTFTIKLVSGSAAYRQGDPGLVNSLDQRGLTRKVFVSIGAYDPDAS